MPSLTPSFPWLCIFGWLCGHIWGELSVCLLLSTCIWLLVLPSAPHGPWTLFPTVVCLGNHSWLVSGLSKSNHFWWGELSTSSPQGPLRRQESWFFLVLPPEEKWAGISYGPDSGRQAILLPSCAPVVWTAMSRWLRKSGHNSLRRFGSFLAVIPSVPCR